MIVHDIKEGVAESVELDVQVFSSRIMAGSKQWRTARFMGRRSQREVTNFRVT